MESKKIKLSREDKIFETLLMFFSIVLLFIVLYTIYFMDDKGNGTLERRKKKSYSWMKAVIASGGASLWENE